MRFTCTETERKGQRITKKESNSRVSPIIVTEKRKWEVKKTGPKDKGVTQREERKKGGRKKVG